MRKNQKGSSLALTLIFATTIGIVLAGVGYTLKTNLLRSKSVNEALQSDLLRKSDLNNQIDNNTLSNPYANQTVPDSAIGNITVHSEVTSLEPIYYSSELYSAKAYLQYIVNQNFSENGKTIFNKTVRYNALPPSSYEQYSDDLIPINVPIINPNNMDNNEAEYRLSDGVMLDTNMGYVDSFKKDASNNLHLVAANKTISTPAGLSSDFKTVIGWDLVNGRWTLYLAIFDASKIYVTNFSLANIMDASVLSPTWQEININANSSSPYIILLKAIWYQPNANTSPNLLVVTKADIDQLIEDNDLYNGNNHKVTVCQVNKGNSHTINIDIHAVDAHLAQGDTIGECDLYDDQGLSFYNYSSANDSLSIIYNDGDDASYRYFTEDKLHLLIPNPAGGLNNGKYIYARIGNVADNHISKLLSIHDSTATNITGPFMSSWSDTTRAPIVVATGDNSLNYFEIGNTQIFSYYQDTLGSPMKTLSNGQSSVMSGDPITTIPGIGFWGSYRSNGGLYYSIAVNQLEEYPNANKYANLPVMENVQRLHDTTNSRVYLKNYGLECATGEKSGDDCNVELTLYEQDTIPLIPLSIGTIHTFTS